MLISCINLEYYPLLSALPSFTSLWSVTVGSEGLGEAFSLPFRGGSGWGFYTTFCGSPAINFFIFSTQIAIRRSRASRVAHAICGVMKALG